MSSLVEKPSDGCTLRNDKVDTVRQRWKSDRTFIWTSAICLMGLSAFVVFPAHCAKHGGVLYYGTVYLIFIIFVVVPMSTLAVGMGQKFQNGNVWPDIHTRLAGIGYASAYLDFL